MCVCRQAFRSGIAVRLEAPVVDQRGHDPIQFQNDQLECIERGKGFLGGSITACMRERGYTILVPKN